MGQILAGRSWEVTRANFCYLAAPRPPIEFLFWDHWETAVLGEIPAGRSWEVTVGYGWLREVGFWAAIEFLSWDQWETAVLSQILAGRSREVTGANFCHLAAHRPAIEFLFWDHWETAVLGEILARRSREVTVPLCIAKLAKACTNKYFPVYYFVLQSLPPPSHTETDTDTDTDTDTTDRQKPMAEICSMPPRNLA